VSTDNPVVVFILLIYSLVLCWGNLSNSNVTMKFTQLHYFSSQYVGGTNDIMSPPVQTLGGRVPPVPPINSVPGGTWTLPETAFASYFLRKVSLVIGK